MLKNFMLNKLVLRCRSSIFAPLKTRVSVSAEELLVSINIISTKNRKKLFFKKKLRVKKSLYLCSPKNGAGVED
jgi:hypothetical protein